MHNRNIPKHVAFIMDGNRRWAKNKGLPTLMGHREGYKNLEKIIEHAKQIGIKHVTFWAFSTENWKRDEKEVAYLLDLLKTQLQGGSVKRIIDSGGKITILGDLSRFKPDLRDALRGVEDRSKDNTDIFINIGLNYGGRAEILKVVADIIKENPQNEITEEMFSDHLYTKGQPDPDLIIRTGGEQRLSGFLPWQGVYSELYFSEKYWPDFDEVELDKAIEVFFSRNRRFGK